MALAGVVDPKRVAGSLYGLLVGDAIAVPAHWFYSPEKLRADYGEITEMVAPKLTHAESMVQGMSYSGTIDIMHDKARYYTGNSLAADAKLLLTKKEIEERKDEHGNYIGVTEDSRVHYHATLKRGQNTVNACIARLAMRYIAETNAGQVDGYDPDEFLQRFVDYMKAKPDPNDTDQLINHNDIYLDIYLRYFFEQASLGKRLRDCPKNQRDQWSIGSLDGVVMSIPIMAAYANEPEAWVIGRAVEHHMLTHRSVTVTATISVLAPLLIELWKGASLKESLDRAMDKLRPPKTTGRELRDSYISAGGPFQIPKDKKWLQHMRLLPPGTTTKDLVHELIATVENDEDVAGCGDREASRLSTMCYCEQAFTVVLYLAYKYGTDDPKKALLQNIMIGGHSTARGAVLGAILGAAHGVDGIPFVDDLCAKKAIDKEAKGLIATF